jgi:hypothetical protein
MRDSTLEELWSSTTRSELKFDPTSISHLPDGARHYLLHSLAPGVILATAVRLRMHGTIRLNGTWYPFRATQVIRWDRGFVWRAKVNMKGLPVTGFDRLVDGEGQMRWKILGIIPMVTASGSEISRAAAGRLHAEACWLPTILLGQGVQWSEHDSSHADATILAHGEESHLALTLNKQGAIQSFCLPRWGDPDKGEFRYENFGGIIEEEQTHDGITIPTKLNIGWFFGSDRFTQDGEFIRIIVDEIEFR